MAANQRIDRDCFFTWFRERLKQIKSIRSIESYILVCVFLDSLSVHRYGGKSKSDKFGRFLIDYSDYGYKFKQISLPLLVYDLEEFPNVYGSLSKTLRQVFKIEESDFSREDHTVDVDLASFRGEIKSKFNESEVEKVCGMAEKFQYHSIFWWKYRCNLIHRGTLPIDELFGVDEKPYPYYYSQLDPPTGRSLIRLKISRKFMIDTLKQCIDKFESDITAKILTE